MHRKRTSPEIQCAMLASLVGRNRHGFPSDRIIAALKSLIASKVFRPGDRLPSIRLLSRSLAANANTVHRAIARLASEGLLVAESSVGVFVATRSNEIPDDSVRIRALEDRLAELVVEAKVLGLNAGQICARLRRRWRRDAHIGELENTPHAL